MSVEDRPAVATAAAATTTRIVVMGVSGSGKSTIGAYLARALGAAFVDGDSLHPEANIEKMESGVPLDDSDRAPWLARVGRVLAVGAGGSGDARPSDGIGASTGVSDGGTAASGVVVACSALKRTYRDEIRAEAPDAVFVELDGTRELLEERLGARTGHFMPSSLLDSQLATLEPLQTDEAGVRVRIDQPVEDIVREAVDGLRSRRSRTT